jgi:transglutaminase-like putative cysteine protease
MLYHVRHLTRYHYTTPVAESVTEVRMHPLAAPYQQVGAFQLHVRPAAHIYEYEDSLGNLVHHFSQPGAHQLLSISAAAEVHVHARPLPPAWLPVDTWVELDAVTATGEHWEMLAPSPFTSRTPRLDDLAAELGVTRRRDPLSLLYELNSNLNRTFAYDAASTNVDSPIDEALKHRRGVCQDLTHIMLALVRNYLHIPCRYISGYLYHRRDDRSVDGATHAWLQAWLPQVGWIGFDPTNNLLQGERHIEVAVGREYSDVPPTRGVYKGNAGSELTVTVRIRSEKEAADAAEGLQRDGQEGVGDSDVEGELGAAPIYRSTEQALQQRYAQALLAMEIQQQQQQQQ